MNRCLTPHYAFGTQNRYARCYEISTQDGSILGRYDDNPGGKEEDMNKMVTEVFNNA